MQKSRIEDHKIKKGKLITPMNDVLGETLRLMSWSKKRLPEYLWIGLIISHYGRNEGLKRVGNILIDISKLETNILYPNITSILSESIENQNAIFKIICNHVEAKILDPLTIILRNDKYIEFNKYFYCKTETVRKKIEVLRENICKYYENHSNDATDIQYLIPLVFVSKGKMHINSNSLVPQAFQEYAELSHDSPEMQMYRSIVRSISNACFEEFSDVDKSNAYCISFWEELGKMTECELYKVDFDDENKTEITKYTIELTKQIQFIKLTYKNLQFSDTKFQVMLASMNYIRNILEEASNVSVLTGILGRSAVRTIVEVYIINKYMLLIAEKYPNVWEGYMEYGMGKYKLTVLKNRRDGEKSFDHIESRILGVLINEKKSEEFLDSEFSYFNKDNIKTKFEKVGEKQLYDSLYEYDTNFVHGMWGAIRESSMTICNNPLHGYHSTVDVDREQKLINVQKDLITISNKMMKILTKEYPLTTGEEL